jgi:hypothetical protein
MDLIINKNEIVNYPTSSYGHFPENKRNTTSLCSPVFFNYIDPINETNKIVVYNTNKQVKPPSTKSGKFTPAPTPIQTILNIDPHTNPHTNPPNNNLNVKINKERSKRVITETKRWTFTKQELEYNIQLGVLNTLVSLINTTPEDEKLDLTPAQMMVYSQIKTKLRSYKEQDAKKHKHDPFKFVTPVFILNKLKECSMICFYCKEFTHILYEHVRDPKQWTIERVDNTFGHNCDNVVIACLSCNLRRRTTHFERYLTTKKLCAGVIKLEGSPSSLDGV